MYIKVGSGWYLLDAPALDESYLSKMDPEVVKKALANPRRFFPLDGKVNAKSIGSRRKTSAEKNVIAAYLQGLKPGADRLAYDRAKTAWVRYSKKMKKDFVKLSNQLARGDLTKSQYIARSRKLFKAGYEKAYRLGTDASGLDFVKLPKEDLAWLKRARASDYKFLDKFADDMVSGKGSMAYVDRAGMYVDTVDSIFDAGRVDAYPNEATKIFWELSSSDNCGDCIELAMNSPYTPATLPTTPRAGGTSCLSNCNCHLRIRYQRDKQAAVRVKPADKSVGKALGAVTPKGAVQNTAKGGDKRDGLKASVQDFKLLPIQTLDWNKLDDMISALTTLRMLENQKPSAYKVKETSRLLDMFEKASQGLPDWLDPFSRDVYVWHAIGTIVLDYIEEAKERGET